MASSTLSYSCRPIKEEYMYETLPDRLRHLAEEDGDKEAFVYYDYDFKRSCISRKELCIKAFALAKVLVQNDLKNKTNVGFCMTNSLDMVMTNMAVVCAGGVPVYFGANLKDGSDVIRLLNMMSCETLIIDANKDDNHWKILQNIWPENSPKSNVVPNLKAIICNGKLSDGISNRTSLSSLQKKTSDVDESIKLPTILPEDILAYFCTSGTTGEPKIVTYTHFNIFNWTKQADYAFGITVNSRFFCDRTFSWVVGYPRTYLVEGVTRVFVDPRITSSGKSTDKVAELVKTENCDIVYIPNYIANDLLGCPHLGPKFDHVDTVIVAGERFPKEFAQLIGTFTKNIAVFYGTTEAGGAVVFKSSDKERFESGIAGTPLSGMEVKLIDSDGNIVRRGEQGELCLRSSWRFVGYASDDTKFYATVDKSNWFHAGDIGFFRDDGNLVLCGRQKELISVQTMKFFPWIIEESLKKMPGAQTAFAVGVPDKRSFEAVCACIVPKPEVKLTANDIKKFCDDVFLDDSPMVVTSKPMYHIVLDAVPLTNSGKINRLRISEIAKQMLEL